MSRETDTPSSGPHGGGAAAYPSGTPPYGTPAGPDTGADTRRSAARPDERKTETTLTTRIKINIPGSRPIPPVVMRKPVTEAEAEGGVAEPVAETPAPAVAEPSAPAAEAPAEPARTGAEKPTSDWFAPRKSTASKGAPGGAPAKGMAPAAGSAPGTPPDGAGRPGPVVGSLRAPGNDRPRATGGTGLTGATGGPVAPGHGGGTGSFDVTEALAAGPLGEGTRPEPRRDDLPFFSEPDSGAGTGAGAGSGAAETYGHEGFQAPGALGGPAGPTGGPVTGDGPLTPPPSPDFPGVPGVPGVPAGALSDDTAILTPQVPAPEPPGGIPGGGPFGNPDNVSGNTVTSGIPVVPGDRDVPFQGGAPTGGPLSAPPRTSPARPEPAAPAPAPAAPAAAAKPGKPAKKKGRNKLVLLFGAVIVVGGVVYGAGLLMNHSDVPKGTTVLGVDIGGGTRDDAVEKLDAAFDDRVNKELKLTVDGDPVALKPDQAGLQFDVQATVDVAAHSDYNPVTVIASLFGNQRMIDPVMPVDEEKLQAALERAAGGAGSMAEGTIEFESGRAVPVYPKAGKGIDADKAAGAVAEAYRTQVGTGSVAAVRVPTTSRQPAVTKAEVDREMKEFAEPAMSANVVVQTDPAHTIEMSPQNSLWKFLGVTAVNGKLVDKPDLAALQELYGQTFDGVLITRANGKKTAVTPEDVYGALRQALLSGTDRVAVIDTDPS